VGPCGYLRATCLRVRSPAARRRLPICKHLTDGAPGRKLWLRPGKLYLFGRTVAERTLNLALPAALKHSESLILAFRHQPGSLSSRTRPSPGNISRSKSTPFPRAAA
jgi:hypothetical protein